MTEETKKEKKQSREKEYIEKLQRLQAEFENFQKRTQKEKEQIRKNANENLILEILPIIDNFEISLKHNEDKGINLIYEELKNTLKKQGLKEIDTSTKFDPKIHEAIAQETGEEDGKILQEIQKGYILNEKLLRPAKVKISKL